MRLAEAMHEPDWIGLGRTIPEETFAGWQEQYQREPFGSNHMYDFLANAFVILSRAFHLPDFALDLTPQSFKWWDANEETQAAGMSDLEIMATMSQWEALRKSGSV